jgi:hypothetical protein
MITLHNDTQHIVHNRNTNINDTQHKKISIIAIRMITLYTMTHSMLYTIGTLNINDTQHNKNQRNGNQHDNTLHYDTQHIVHNCYTSINDTQHNKNQNNGNQHNNNRHNDIQHNNSKRRHSAIVI